MKKFKVGGAIRDLMMGREPNDIDWVVTEAVPEDLLAKGYKQVGKDFPIFLHPETNEEHAFPRGLDRVQLRTMPAKSQLEWDLKRRDLTMNAMAMDEQGQLVDPCQGYLDIQKKIIRHISDETFSEDPIRVLRVARFLTRFSDFTLAEETEALCKKIVQEGKLNIEQFGPRILLDVVKGFDESIPSAYMKSLERVGALPVIFQHVYKTIEDPLMFEAKLNDMDILAETGVSFQGMMATLMLGASTSDIDQQMKSWKGSSSLHQTIGLYAKQPNSLDLEDKEAVVSFLEKNSCVKDSVSLFHVVDMWEAKGFDAREFWVVLEQVRSVKGDEIAEKFKGEPMKIREALHDARVKAISSEVLFVPEFPNQ